MPFGCLLGDFSRHFRGLWAFAGWHSLSSESPIFSGFGGPRSALLRPLFQVRILGCVFIVFYADFCDFGSSLGSLLAPFGPPFLGELAIRFRIGEKVASGVAKESLLGAFGYHLGGFLVIFRRIQAAIRLSLS